MTGCIYIVISLATPHTKATSAHRCQLSMYTNVLLAKHRKTKHVMAVQKRNWHSDRLGRDQYTWVATKACPPPRPTCQVDALTGTCTMQHLSCNGKLQHIAAVVRYKSHRKALKKFLLRVPRDFTLSIAKLCDWAEHILKYCR